MSAARFSAAQAAQANSALAFMLGWSRPAWMPVYQDREGRSIVNWHHVGVPGAGPLLGRHVRTLDELYSYEIAYGLPRRERGAGAARGTVLWARVEGKDQLKRARTFRPLPTCVLQEGSSTRRLLIWALWEPADFFAIQEANRRIAYHLRAVQKHGEPDALRVPAPGTFMRMGRSRPAPVVVTRLEPDFFTAAGVAGRLREPPPKDAWLSRIKEGSR